MGCAECNWNAVDASVEFLVICHFYLPCNTMHTNVNFRLMQFPFQTSLISHNNKDIPDGVITLDRFTF
jgi:hypothetical protein